MKKCPFCQAEIAENARFCLYCMRPLTSKQEYSPKVNKRWWLAVLPILLIVGGLVLWLLQDDTTPSGSASVYAPVPEQTNPSGQTIPAQTEPHSLPSTEDTNPISPLLPSESEQNQKPTGNGQADLPSGGSQAATPSVPDPEITEPSAEETSPVTTSPSTEASTEPTTEPTTQTTEPVYTYETSNGIPGTLGYRTQHAVHSPLEQEEDVPFYPAGSDVFDYYDATASDVPDDSYINGCVAMGNYASVRCGIYTVSATTQSGKKVVAIRNVRLGDIVMLTVPASVVAIGPSALDFNYEFKYLCIKGETINIDITAFPPVSSRWYQIVIRCSATCKNSDGEYIKDIVGRYGAVWEEWNG